LERKIYYFIAIFLTIIITIGSLISVDKVVELPPVQFLDKLLHIAAYFFLALSWLLATKNVKQQNSIFVTVLVVFIYGIIIEVLQGVITNYRQTDLFDMLANLCGIVIAWLIFRLISQKIRMK